MRANLRELSQAAAFDPRRALLDAAGDLSTYEVFHNLVLVATYIQPPRIMKGPNGEDIEFHSTDKGLMEDRFQGKVGLVLKVGPLAFRDDNVAKFGGVVIEPGEWVIYRPSDGIETFIRDRRKTGDGLPCRLFEDTQIKGRVSEPALIY